MTIKLAESFKAIREYITINTKDWCHINDGDEGSGKGNICFLILEQLFTPEQLKDFFDHIADHVHYTIENFGYSVRNSSFFDVNILDEPVELLARTPTASTNIELMKTLFTAREKRNIILFNVQRLFTIDWVVRDRARSLAHCYYITNTRTLNDSYFYKYFSKPRMKKIWYEEKTHIVHYPFPNYWDRVNDFFGDRYPKYWKKYLDHKNSMTYLKKEEDRMKQIEKFKEYLDEVGSGDIMPRYKEYYYSKGRRKKEMLMKWSKLFEQPVKVIQTWVKKIEEGEV